MVFLAFMILNSNELTAYDQKMGNIPDDGSLDNVFTIFVNSLEDVRGLCLNLRLDRLIQIDTDLLRLEALQKVHSAQE
jgi:hypothetical protein